MGIDVTALKFLRHCRTFGPFNSTLTIGRQEIHAADLDVRRILRAPASYRHDKYSERLLTDYFGATSVESTDKSDYEGATRIHDMNQVMPPELRSRYDSIIDIGSLEHVFNIAQALDNCSHAVKVGGQVIHVLPSNNFCGHGFLQCSPELFFSLYSAKNGYENTEVYLATPARPHTWFRVKAPADGKRVEVASSKGLYVLVRTVRAQERFSHASVQQSDYVHRWAVQEPVARGTELGPMRALKNGLRRWNLGYAALFPVYRFLHSRLADRPALNKSNSNLIEVSID